MRKRYWQFLSFLFLSLLMIPLMASTPCLGAADYNVILICIDTLRADHLGCYGYSRDTSPHLDAFARESVFFENAYSTTAWTFPSHFAMFTARYPDPDRLRIVRDELFRYGGVPLIGWTAPFLRLLSRRKRYRKRAPIARALEEILEVRENGNTSDA